MNVSFVNHFVDLGCHHCWSSRLFHPLMSYSWGERVCLPLLLAQFHSFTLFQTSFLLTVRGHYSSPWKLLLAFLLLLAELRHFLFHNDPREVVTFVFSKDIKDTCPLHCNLKILMNYYQRVHISFFFFNFIYIGVLPPRMFVWEYKITRTWN